MGPPYRVPRPPGGPLALGGGRSRPWGRRIKHVGEGRRGEGSVHVLVTVDPWPDTGHWPGGAQGPGGRGTGGAPGAPLGGPCAPTAPRLRIEGGVAGPAVRDLASSLE